MPRKNPFDPENLPKHQFPQSLLKQIEENAGGGFGSFFLVCKDQNGEFVLVPNFKNQPDKLSFLVFLQMWTQTMLENSAIQLDNEISEETFGDDE